VTVAHRRYRRRRTSSFCEQLEGRLLLAAVSWDGGGDGQNWTDPLNWSTDSVPDATSDVTVNSASSLTVRVAPAAQARHARSLATNQTVLIEAGATLSVDGGGITLDEGTIELAGAGSSAALQLNTSAQAINGTGQVVLAGTSANNSISAAQLTIGPDVLISGRGSLSSTSLVNQGDIVVDAAAEKITITSNGSFTNNGTLAASNGGDIEASFAGTAGQLACSGAGSKIVLTGTGASGFVHSAPATVTDGGLLQFRGTWSNTSVISAGPGGTIELGGTVTTTQLGQLVAGGGPVVLTGTLDNTAATLSLSAATGPLDLGGGIIRGGVIVTPPGSPLLRGTSQQVIVNEYSTLDGVVLNGDAVVLDAGILVVKNGLTLNGTVTVAGRNSARTALRFPATQTVLGTATIILDNPKSYLHVGEVFFEPAIVTLASTVTVFGEGGVLDTPGADLSSLINHGTIRSDRAGKTLSIATNDLLNHGTIEASGGGRLTIANLANYNPQLHSLTGGAWVARAGSTISLPAGHFVTRNESDVTLDGFGASFSVIDSLLYNAAGAAFRLSGGRAFAADDELSNAGVLSVASGASLQIAGGLRGSGHSDIGAGGSLAADYIWQGLLHVEGTASIRQSGSPDSLSVLNSLTIDPPGRFDLVDNDLLIRAAGPGAQGAVAALIASARDGGTWLGAGLTSSSARDAPLVDTTLGVVSADDYRAIHGPDATFAGQALGEHDVLVKYTYYGDTDLNGLVDGDDYSRADAGFNSGSDGWINGDFDLNGVVDGDDYALLDSAFGTQAGTL
jgi:hypothetical protein